MAFSFSGAGSGAADKLLLLLAHRRADRIAEDEMERRRQELAQRNRALELQAKQEERIAEAQQYTMGRQAQADEAERAADAQKSARAHDEAGVRAMFGEIIRNQPDTPETRRQIAGMMVQEGVGRPQDALALISKPPQERRVIRVPGPGGAPMEKSFTEEELAQGVPVYTAPPTPREGPQQPWQWVLRDGQEVYTNRSQPGDRRAPSQNGAGVRSTVAENTRLKRVEAARGFIGTLNDLRTKINTKMGPQAGAGGLVRRGAAAIGLDPDVAVYERLRNAAGRALAVAVMGAQNLSDPDADSWARLFPDATTDEQTAKRLMDQVESQLNLLGEEADPGSFPAGDIDALLDEVLAGGGNARSR